MSGSASARLMKWRVCGTRCTTLSSSSMAPASFNTWHSMYGSLGGSMSCRNKGDETEQSAKGWWLSHNLEVCYSRPTGDEFGPFTEAESEGQFVKQGHGYKSGLNNGFQFSCRCGVSKGSPADVILRIVTTTYHSTRTKTEAQEPKRFNFWPPY